MGRENGAAHGMPFLTLEIELTSQTIHVALQPNDVRLLVAVWFDNFSRDYLPPPDPSQPVLPPSTIELCVKMHLSSVVMWLHRSDTSRPSAARTHLKPLADTRGGGTRWLTRARIPSDPTHADTGSDPIGSLSC